MATVSLTSPTTFHLALAAALLCPLLLLVPWRGMARTLTGQGHREPVARPRWQRLLGGLVRRATRWALVVLCQLLAILAVFTWANDTYGLFGSWSDVIGGQNDTAANGAQDGAVLQAIEQAHPLPGPRIKRVKISPSNRHRNGKWVNATVPGLDPQFGPVRIWLPPQYFEKSEKDSQFPVLLGQSALHQTGTAFADQLQAGPMMLRTITSGKASPFIAVYLPSRVKYDVDSECVDLPDGTKGQSWYTTTLIDYLRSHYRTVAPGKGWFSMGYSTGGQCSAVLVAKHPDIFTAGVNMAGYFTPVFDDPSVIQGDKKLYSQNSPLAMVRAKKLKQFRVLSVMSTSDPQSWGNGGQLKDAGQVMGDGQVFEPLARELPGAAFLLLHGVGHEAASYLPYWEPSVEWLGMQGL